MGSAEDWRDFERDPAESRAREAEKQKKSALQTFDLPGREDQIEVIRELAARLKAKS